MLIEKKLNKKIYINNPINGDEMNSDEFLRILKNAQEKYLSALRSDFFKVSQAYICFQGFLIT